MYFMQVARAILENPKDKTKISLIYANVTYEDILLKVHIIRYIKYMMFDYIWGLPRLIILMKPNERLRTISVKWRS